MVEGDKSNVWWSEIGWWRGISPIIHARFDVVLFGACVVIAIDAGGGVAMDVHTAGEQALASRKSRNSHSLV